MFGAGVWAFRRCIPAQMPLPKSITVEISVGGHDSLTQSRIPYLKLALLHKQVILVSEGQPSALAWDNMLVMQTFCAEISTVFKKGQELMPNYLHHMAGGC